MISFMWQWVNNPIALIAGFVYQLSCCKKTGDWKRRFLPLILYLVAALGCILEGVFLTTDPSGAQVGLQMCIFIGYHAVFSQLAWPLYYIIRWFKKKKEDKYKNP